MKSLAIAKLDQESTYSGDMMSGILSAVDRVQNHTEATSEISMSLKPLTIDEVLTAADRSSR